MDQYELDDDDRALIAKAREAIEYQDNGGDCRDVMDEDEMIDALRLQLRIVDGE